MRGHPFSSYAKVSEKLICLTLLLYVYTYVRERNQESGLGFRIPFTYGIRIKKCCFFQIFYLRITWLIPKIFKQFPANIYLFKVKNRNTRKRYEICSKLTIKTLERRQ